MAKHDDKTKPHRVEPALPDPQFDSYNNLCKVHVCNTINY